MIVIEIVKRFRNNEKKLKRKLRRSAPKPISSNNEKKLKHFTEFQMQIYNSVITKRN